MEGGAESPQLLRVAADSSPLSAESTFRELDDVFLQTQTRIWLGEVLHIRLNEQQSISDLLADGELLFEVSEVIWDMLLTRCTEIKNIKACKYEPSASRKSSGRYTPYSNVDSFLKVCRTLGLSGVDLFSPSDVVEKRDTRKVCICIRSLSKKARSRQLNVPDFDIVSYTVAMPTDIVGCIRRSLEQSNHSVSDTPSYSSNQGPGSNCRKKISFTVSEKDYNSCSEESDDSDCKFTIDSNSSPTSFSYDALVQKNSDIIDSPGVSSVTRNNTSELEFSESDIQNQGEHVEAHQFQSLCLSESGGSCSPSVKSDYLMDDLSSSLRVYSSGGLENSDTELDLQNGASVLESLSEISHSVNCTAGTSDFIQSDEDNTPKQCTSPGSYGSCSTPRTVENGFCDSDDVVISSTDSFSPVLNLDIDDQLDKGDDVEAFLGLDGKSRNIVKYDKLVDSSTSNTENLLKDMGVMDLGFLGQLVPPCPSMQSCADQDVLHDDQLCMSESADAQYEKERWSQAKLTALKNIHCKQCKELLTGDYNHAFDFNLWDQKGKCLAAALSNLGFGNYDHRSLHSFSAEDDLLMKDIKSGANDNNDKRLVDATTFELDEPNNNFSTTHSDNSVDKRKEDRRRDNGGGCKHQDIMVEVIGDHDRASKDDSSSHNNFVFSAILSGSACDEYTGSTTGYPENMNLNNNLPISLKNDSSHAANVEVGHCQDDKKHEYAEVLAAQNSDGSVPLARQKPRGRQLLKSFVKGTAVAGVLFLLLQLRKPARKKEGVPKTSSNQKVTANSITLPLQHKQHKEGRVNEVVYPANKLRFGI